MTFLWGDLNQENEFYVAFHTPKVAKPYGQRSWLALSLALNAAMDIRFSVIRNEKHSDVDNTFFSVGNTRKCLAKDHEERPFQPANIPDIQTDAIY